MRLRAIVAAAAMAAASSVAFAAAEKTPPLEPYQLVRSLQIVQDRIAAGDHAALPMQRKLLEMIDARLRRAISPEFDDRRNFESMLVYAMSGGNPMTLDAVLSRLTLSEEDRKLGRAIRAYLRGELIPAMQIFDTIDPRGMSAELGSFVALLKGSVIAKEDPKAALTLFDWARLVGTGTLVEEAALRRSLPLAASTSQPQRFMAVTSAYVRRFLRSPYATQFADELVSGIVKLASQLDFRSIEESVGEMSAEHQRVIYLRLARTSAIEGLHDLSDFASRKARDFESGEGGQPDERAILYASLSSVTSDTAPEIIDKLTTINRTRLSQEDLRLLEAALEVARTVTTLPPVDPPEPPVVSEAPDAAVEPAADPQMAEPVQTEAPRQEASLGTEPATAQAPNVEDAPIEIVTDTKRRLAEIDKLLELDP